MLLARLVLAVGLARHPDGTEGMALAGLLGLVAPVLVKREFEAHLGVGSWRGKRAQGVLFRAVGGIRRGSGPLA